MRAQGTPLIETEFRAQMAVMAAQRNAKIVGIFARLYKRDGKPRYLSYLPRVWGYLNKDLEHPALAGLKSCMIAPSRARRAVHPKESRRDETGSRDDHGGRAGHAYASFDGRSAETAGDGGGQDADRPRARPAGRGRRDAGRGQRPLQGGDGDGPSRQAARHRNPLFGGEGRAARDRRRRGEGAAAFRGKAVLHHELRYGVGGGHRPRARPDDRTLGSGDDGCAAAAGGDDDGTGLRRAGRFQHGWRWTVVARRGRPAVPLRLSRRADRPPTAVRSCAARRVLDQPRVGPGDRHGTAVRDPPRRACGSMSERRPR